MSDNKDEQLLPLEEEFEIVDNHFRQSDSEDAASEGGRSSASSGAWEKVSEGEEGEAVAVVPAAGATEPQSPGLGGWLTSWFSGSVSEEPKVEHFVVVPPFEPQELRMDLLGEAASDDPTLPQRETAQAEQPGSSGDQETPSLSDEAVGGEEDSPLTAETSAAVFTDDQNVPSKHELTTGEEGLLMAAETTTAAAANTEVLQVLTPGAAASELYRGGAGHVEVIVDSAEENLKQVKEEALVKDRGDVVAVLENNSSSMGDKTTAGALVDGGKSSAEKRTRKKKTKPEAEPVKKLKRAARTKENKTTVVIAANESSGKQAQKKAKEDSKQDSSSASKQEVKKLKRDDRQKQSKTTAVIAANESSGKRDARPKQSKAAVAPVANETSTKQAPKKDKEDNKPHSPSAGNAPTPHVSREGPRKEPRVQCKGFYRTWDRCQDSQMFHFYNTHKFKNFDADQFLNRHPRPYYEFEKSKHKKPVGYRVQALTALANVFPYQDMPVVVNTFDACGGRFCLAFRKLQEERRSVLGWLNELFTLRRPDFHRPTALPFGESLRAEMMYAAHREELMKLLHMDKCSGCGRRHAPLEDGTGEESELVDCTLCGLAWRRGLHLCTRQHHAVCEICVEKLVFRTLNCGEGDVVLCPRCPRGSVLVNTPELKVRAYTSAPCDSWLKQEDGLVPQPRSDGAAPLMAWCPHCYRSCQDVSGDVDNIMRCTNPYCGRVTCRLCGELAHGSLSCGELRRLVQKELGSRCARCCQPRRALPGIDLDLCPCGADGQCRACGRQDRSRDFGDHFNGLCCCYQRCRVTVAKEREKERRTREMKKKQVEKGPLSGPVVEASLDLPLGKEKGLPSVELQYVRAELFPSMEAIN